MNTNGKVIARSTVIPLDPSNHDVTAIKMRMSELDDTIKTKIGDYHNAMNSTHTDLPEIDDDNLEKQLAFTFDLKKRSDLNENDFEHETASDPH